VSRCSTRPTIGHNLRLAVDEIAADIEIFHHQH
jgi:hypothetical protein